MSVYTSGLQTVALGLDVALSLPLPGPWGTIPSTTYTNDGDTIPHTDTSGGALFLPLTPMRGHYISVRSDKVLVGEMKHVDMWMRIPYHLQHHMVS